MYCSRQLLKSIQFNEGFKDTSKTFNGASLFFSSINQSTCSSHSRKVKTINEQQVCRQSILSNSLNMQNSAESVALPSSGLETYSALKMSEISR